MVDSIQFVKAHHAVCFNVCPQKEKLQLKKEQLIAKVQRDEDDHSSVEVKGEFLFFSAGVRCFHFGEK